ncbi:MAG: hypothetical protein ACRD3V_28935 [Vicinamibacteria bacterium]
MIPRLAILVATLVTATVFAVSCGEDSPAAPTSIGSAPAVVTPSSGSVVDSRQPTLTVTNVNVSGATPTYHFQVAADSGFADIIAEASNVAQGAGQTSWQVTESLENLSYFWRARAEMGATTGPFSSATEFSVNAPGFASGTPLNGVLVYDPLTNGTSVGVRVGGEFTPEGWQVKSRSDYIRYAVPTTEAGYVEWDNSNMEDVVPDKQWMLFAMWDPSRGGYTQNAYRVGLQKLDSGHRSPYFRVRWISNGEQYDFGNDFEEWDLFKTYRIRVEWGPGIGSQIVRVFIDGQEQYSQTYVNIYRPATHWIELGVQERKESIVGVIYSNVEIGTR